MKTYTEEQMKLASKHTPGPYLVEKHPYKRGVYRIIDNNTPYKNTVADIFGDSVKQSLANANLLGSAPEAIEFIADLVNKICTRKITDGDLEDFVEKAEPILKKAYNL